MTITQAIVVTQCNFACMVAIYFVVRIDFCTCRQILGIFAVDLLEYEQLEVKVFCMFCFRFTGSCCCCCSNHLD